MVAELIPMPLPPQEILRVNRIFPFEESGKKLLMVVENAAFAELDEATWRAVHLIADKERVYRRELVEALSPEFGAEEAQATVAGLVQLEVLVPKEAPRLRTDLEPLPVTPLTSLVLHVAHDCNMRCGYCYADYGRYGGDFGYMDPALAVKHTEKFFDQLGPTSTVHMTFFGGEPLLNMPVVFAAHEYAKARALKEGRKIGFGLTTNATLLTDELVAFFTKERFTVTVSIDGPPDINDRLRPLQDGAKSYDVIMERIRATGLKAHARVTLTRRCTDIARIVRHLAEAGFEDIGVSPVATGSDKFDLDGDGLQKVLAGLKDLADDYVEWAKRGKTFPFSNIRTVLEQISAGDPRPVPCGAATKLVAADNKGDLYACHRLVGQEQFKIGHVDTGVDEAARYELIQSFHPRTRKPCQTCCAHYLRGGCCHHIAWLHTEKKAAPWAIGDHFCDFLRGWYRLGLYTYARMAEEAPEALDQLRGRRSTSACNQPQGQ